MKIEVTIGVVVRNCAKDVRQIVNQISSQDFPHEKLEVIFVDDGSQDNTLFEILQHAPKMNVLYRVCQHKWKGLGYSRNVALTNAQGDYIVWFDDGTIFPNDYVRKQMEFIENHSSVSVVRGFVGVYSGPNRVATLENMVRLPFGHRYAGKSTTKFPGSGGSVYRVKAAKQVGGFDENIHGACEDVDIAFRMFSAGWQIYITPVKFLLDYDESLRKVWNKSSSWYGYGAHYVLHKHKELRKMLPKNIPLVGFLEGVLDFPIAYRLTHKKIALLLPTYYFSKRIMWYIGCIKGHIDSYEPVKGILPVTTQNAEINSWQRQFPLLISLKAKVIGKNGLQS